VEHFIPGQNRDFQSLSFIFLFSEVFINILYGEISNTLGFTWNLIWEQSSESIHGEFVI
jgi:hypothetical protein